MRFRSCVLTHVVKQEMGQPPTPTPSLFWQERAGGERRRRRGKSRSSIILALVEALDWTRAFIATTAGASVHWGFWEASWQHLQVTGRELKAWEVRLPPATWKNSQSLSMNDG